MDASSAFETASRRCFTTPEIINLLSANTPLSLSSAPPSSPPPSGSLFLYDRSAVRHYKRDGHDWVTKAVSNKRRTGRVREDDVRLRLGEQYRVAGYYARSATAGGTMRRRTYCLIDPVSLKPEDDFVLVHYLDTGTDEVRRHKDVTRTDIASHDSRAEGKSRARTSRWVDHAEEFRSHAKMGLVETEQDRKEKKDGKENNACRSMANDVRCQGKCPRLDVLQSSSAPGKLSAQQKAFSSVSEFLSAPQMTEERMAEEWVSFNETEKSAAIGDIYGIAATADDLNESPDYNVPNEFANELQTEILMIKLSLMNDEIGRIPIESKLCYLEAVQKCPHLVSPVDVKLQFLRCECFRPQEAAHRLVKYWTKRVEVFGRDGAFLPLSLEGTMANFYEEPGFGYVKLLSGLDASGRAVFFVDNTIHCTNSTAVRSIWYVVHAAMENESVKREGFVVVNYTRPSPEVMNLQCRMEHQSLIRDIFPLRLRAVHLCNWRTNDLSGWFVKTVIAALAFAVGPYIRSRVVFHDGSKDKVLVQLAEYGIPIHQLPTKMGGTFTDEDYRQWLVLRREAGM